MSVKSFLRTGSAAAIAAVLAVGALSSPVHAAGEPDGNSEDAGQRARPSFEARAEARQARQEERAAQAPQRTWQAPQQQQRTFQSPDPEEWRGRDWNRGGRRGDAGTIASGREWNRGGGDWQAQARAQAEAQARAQAQVNAQTAERGPSGSWDRRGQRDRWGNSARVNGGWERNRTYSDAARNRGYGDHDYRDEQYRRQQNTYPGGYRTDHYRDDHRSWSRDWRRDNRYNWYSYRNSNRNVFRLGRYYSPYRNYSYSRVNIGFRLGSLFFGSRYWINDPWRYRLPEPYGPYRWVRYYDDALLVDVYSGQVVDVIYDFFW